MNENIILFGAGTIGRLIARQLIAKGTPPLCFADNDPAKWSSSIEAIPVMAPFEALLRHPDAKWVATVHRTPHRQEIIDQIHALGVESVSLYEFIPARCDIPPVPAEKTILRLAADLETVWEWTDQVKFRKDPRGHAQQPPRDIANVYFENFFTHRDDEHFVDCGAADGDTIRDFCARWPKHAYVTAFEPDPANFAKLQESRYADRVAQLAIGDKTGTVYFSATGDQTAHVNGKDPSARDGDGIPVTMIRLDDWEFINPTFIKMDIEGSELEGLWGARETIQKHRPVLAICAYHTGDHLWQIPLMIHAIYPDYRLYLRRYLEATWELIWYAVPPERVK